MEKDFKKCHKYKLGTKEFTKFLSPRKKERKQYMLEKNVND